MVQWIWCSCYFLLLFTEKKLILTFALISYFALKVKYNAGNAASLNVIIFISLNDFFLEFGLRRSRS